KNFSASMFIRGDFGHKGKVSAFSHPGNGTYDRTGMRHVPYWTPENPSNKYGSITAAASAFAGGYGIYFDRSFVRIQDVSLSYLFNSQAIAINKIRLFVSVRNLLTFDNWKDWDPESNNTPMPRTFSIGLNFEL